MLTFHLEMLPYDEHDVLASNIFFVWEAIRGPMQGVSNLFRILNLTSRSTSLHMSFSLCLSRFPASLFFLLSLPFQYSPPSRLSDTENQHNKKDPCPRHPGRRAHRSKTSCTLPSRLQGHSALCDCSAYTKSYQLSRSRS